MKKLKNRNIAEVISFVRYHHNLLHHWPIVFFVLHVNSLWPTNTIRRQGPESTLAQVMPCCLTAPSHYLNQCWLIISKVLRLSSEGIIMRRSEDTSQQNKIEHYIFRITFRSPRGQWVNMTSHLRLICGHTGCLCSTALNTINPQYISTQAYWQLMQLRSQSLHKTGNDICIQSRVWHVCITCNLRQQIIMVLTWWPFVTW